MPKNAVCSDTDVIKHVFELTTGKLSVSETTIQKYFENYLFRTVCEYFCTEDAAFNHLRMEIITDMLMQSIVVLFYPMESKQHCRQHKPS